MPEQRGWNWYWVCLAAWAAMMGAWAAAADVLGLPDFVLRTGTLIVAAFPVAYYLRFSGFSRTSVNLVVLLAAAILGVAEFIRTFQPMLLEAGGGLGNAYRFLIAAFLWITALRAFALRNLSDMQETVVPVGSILLLVLVCQPTAIAVLGTVVALMGSVALLAAAHEESWAEPVPEFRTIAGPRNVTVQTADSWVTVYLVGLIAAIIAAQGFRSADITSVLGRELQIRMARVLARYFVPNQASYVSGEARLYLWGPAPMSNRPLFEVEATANRNWRMGVYTHYDGWSWSPGFRPRYSARRVSQDTYRLTIPSAAGKGPKGRRVVMTVRARLPMGGIVPALFWPQWLVHRQLVRPRQAKVDELGELWLTRYVRPGDSYRVIALEPLAGHEPARLPEKMRQACLQLPDDFSPRVRQLAQELAGNKRTPVAKMMAIGNYLALNCTYDEFPDYPPRGTDPVEFFLFETHRGYCLHFASAFVLMCRCVGLPARLVTGFLEGDTEQGSDVHIVRAKDAHAWAEVFIPREGWSEYDPTPPRPLTASQRAAQTWDQMTESLGTVLARLGRWAEARLLLMALIAVLGIACWGAVRQVRWQQTLRVRRAGISPRRQIQHAWARACAWFTDLGQPPPSPATPLEFVASLGEEWEPVRSDLQKLAWLYTCSLYAPVRPRPEQAEQAVGAAEKIRDHWLQLRRRHS
ncbi:MAG: transglutaminase domain-containing protein [Armatimonadetes bacterium]|nr:transglutaminase domain-containing protein [Armatimonadota bacterium]